ncbi:arginine deiminase [Vallitalea okinawensis]|uniref:arginine deiminase n=1 Tax=Vallitalea okinawensis TaxID=2078660 RepID=UPI000CFD1183|nr:arginine deiminase [Vallitalea okinawensis]
MSADVLNVTSEIGKLKTVLLHRPGKELENLTPETLDRLLFDDIPYLKVAVEEHDEFAKLLGNNGVEVLYLEDLVAEAITSDEIRHELLQEFLHEGKIYDPRLKEAMFSFFDDYNKKELVLKMMEGVRKKELEHLPGKTLANLVSFDYPFILDPMPNLYFTRDPFATIGSGITLNRMRTETRNRETIFAKYIFKYHKRFKDFDIPLWYTRDENSSIEGGDELVLSKNVIAIGISQRTQATSIEKVAKKILNSNQSFDTILAFDIPKSRAFMHLDTVFTMIDHDKFTIHHEIEGPLTVYSITLDGNNELKIVEEQASLEDTLKKYLGLEHVTLIKCAGGDKIDARREQWNDGSNTLAIAPGEVVVYSRNYVTNRILEENGIITHTIPSSELSRGRGGPRCMSMPLLREPI